MPAIKPAPLPLPGHGARYPEALERALVGLYDAKRAVRDNKAARDEFEHRIDVLIDDLEREWSSTGGPPVEPTK